jgi:hypothetical protein
MLLGFASTVVPDFILLEIHDQGFLFSLRHAPVKWGLLFDEGGIGLSM